MKTLGIITEYNPFHQGHAYMLERAKRKADADRVVVIMSGSFVQRGEPAIFDKWICFSVLSTEKQTTSGGIPVFVL